MHLQIEFHACGYFRTFLNNDANIWLFDPDGM